jgi:hypothetical protein
MKAGVKQNWTGAVCLHKPQLRWSMFMQDSTGTSLEYSQKFWLHFSAIILIKQRNSNCLLWAESFLRRWREVQLLRKFLLIYGTYITSITMSTTAFHWILPRATWIQSLTSHSIYWIFIIIFYLHICLVAWNGDLPSGFGNNILHAFLIPYMSGPSHPPRWNMKIMCINLKFLFSDLGYDGCGYWDYSFLGLDR